MTFRSWREGAAGQCRSYTGLGFNGAMTFRSWRAVVRIVKSGAAVKLQWGHDLSVMESFESGDFNNSRRRASMGP